MTKRELINMLRFCPDDWPVCVCTALDNSNAEVVDFSPSNTKKRITLYTFPLSSPNDKEGWPT